MRTHTYKLSSTPSSTCSHVCRMTQIIVIISNSNNNHSAHPEGHTLDTQSTASWVGHESPSRVPPPMVLDEILQLSKDELGVVLFSDEFRVSRGTMACRDFFCSDFCEEKNLRGLLTKHAPQPYIAVLEMVQQMLQDMVKSLNLGLPIGNFPWAV